MVDVKIFVGYHCATAVIFAFADNVDPRDVKSIGITNDSANIKIVAKIFNGDLYTGAGFIELSNYSLILETFETIN